MVGSLTNLSNWRTERARYRADVVLSPESLSASDLVEAQFAGFDVHMLALEMGMPIPVDIARSSQALVVEVRCDQPSAVERLHRLLGERGSLPVLAAIREPSLADMRTLMRIGVADILPLPLKAADLAQALERISIDLDRRHTDSAPRGRIIPAIKSRGGVGATTILTQIGCILSAASRFRGAPPCLVDFDLQFGNAALYLGQLPELGIRELLDAGDRLDGAMLKSALSRHASGLSYLAAPQEVVPLETLNVEQVDSVMELVRREFSVVLIDLPPDWTVWSLSILAEADQILLVSELSIASLHQAKRQLEFLRQQDLGHVPVNVVMNKVSKGLFKSVDLQDAARILGREVAFTIADDAVAVRSALDQGEPLAQVNPRSRTARDLGELAVAILAKTAVAS